MRGVGGAVVVTNFKLNRDKVMDAFPSNYYVAIAKVHEDGPVILQGV